MNLIAYRQTMRQIAAQMLQLTPRVVDEHLRRELESLTEKIIEVTNIADEDAPGPPVTDTLRRRF
jgi:hypothetical protein